ncbi:EamA family transporter [Lacibacterium aquatile]|uniref:EamA family transporter n=1 Tax=Lacibacterium aquatile TaxID=1168082 RepID=A0ABW5DWL7_9PROT
MPIDVLLIVLVGALLHASWNVAVKSGGGGGGDRVMDVILVAAGNVIVGCLFLPFVDFPPAQSWPLIAVSTIIHSLYFPLIAMTYQAGDVTVGYPIMRGGGVLLSALLAAFLATDLPGPLGWAGIFCIGCGILALALFGRGNARVLLMGGATALTVAAYTLVDGLGARSATSAFSYAAWLVVVQGVFITAVGLIWRGGALVRHARVRGKIMIPAGMISVVSYMPALWAMTKAPIALVAALRETSIVFATLLGVLFLKEKVPHQRYIAIAAIIAGAVLVKFS